MAVDPRQNLDSFAGVHAFQKPPDGLKVSVTAFDVVKVVDLSVNKVKVNLCRAHQGTRNRRYVSDTVSRFVSNYLEIITDVHSSNH